MTKAITTRYTERRNKPGYFATDGDGNSVFVPTSSLAATPSYEVGCRNAALALCAKMKWKGSLAGAHLLKAGQTVGMVWVWLDSTKAIHATTI